MYQKSKKNFLTQIKNTSGFTLVELMVVVAIIGILSAVAIPNFRKYQAKSKTSEAKLQISALYMAETSAMSDFDVYVTCLRVIGFDIPNTTSSYYAIGFSPSDDPTANTTAELNGLGITGTCKGRIGNTQSAWGAGKTVGGKSAAISNLLATWIVNATDGTTFTAGAFGYVDADRAKANTADQWQIDELKRVSHLIIGY